MREIVNVTPAQQQQSDLPMMQLQELDGVGVNVYAGLEREADELGNNAVRTYCWSGEANADGRNEGLRLLK